MTVRQSRNVASAVVIALFSALAALISYFFPLSFPDEVEYWTLASNLAESGTFSYDGKTPSAYRPPLVPLVLTPIAAAGLPMTAARPLFVVFYAASGVLCAYLLARFFASSWWIPPLGTAFVLSHPLYLFSAGNLYPQQVLTPLLLAALVLACWKPASQRGVILRSVGIGLLTGASLLASAPALFSLLPVLALLVWEDLIALRHGRVLTAHRALAVGIVCVLCIAPLLARNARNVHPGLYLSLNSGINLLFGNSPRTTPTSGVNVDLSEYGIAGPGESEFDANQRLTAVAVRNIREDPGYYARLFVRKFVAGLSNAVETVTHGYNKKASLAMQGYMTLVWLGVVAVCVVHLRGRSVPLVADTGLMWTFGKLTAAAYLFTIAGYAIFFPRLRFRLPVDVAIGVLGAAGWAMLTIMLLNGTSRRADPAGQARRDGR